MAKVHSTGKTLFDNRDPTSKDTHYNYKGSDYLVQECWYWYNSTSKNLFFCIKNDGTDASWKKFTLDIL